MRDTPYPVQQDHGLRVRRLPFQKVEAHRADGDKAFHRLSVKRAREKRKGGGEERQHQFRRRAHAILHGISASSDSE